MDFNDRDFSTREEIISRTTSAEDIISALAKRGCSDLTGSIDLSTCSAHPVAGGGFCDVYRGNLDGGAKVAIKTLRLYERPGRDDERAKILKRAARELYLWSKLQHPNVLQLLGLATFRGQLSMISEWMESGDLMSYIRRNPDANRINLCRDICAGLSYIHANETVHGDLKAANVMVSHNGTAMIADFGNAQLKNLTLRFTNSTTSSLSVRWAAPELLDEDSDFRLSKKADIYAYGMTVLVGIVVLPDKFMSLTSHTQVQETLTGKVPYEEQSEQQVLIMVAIKRKTPPRPAVEISDELWEIMQRCWSFDRSQRPDATVIEEQLRALFLQPAMTTLAINDSSQISMSAMGASLSEIDAETTPQRVIEENRPNAPLLGMANVATTYKQQGRLADAESLESQVLVARKRVLGEEHPDTLSIKASLADTYKRQGRFADAETLELEVLGSQAQSLGRNHPATLQSMGNLAVTYHEQGRLGDAESLAVELVTAQKQALGDDHPDTLAVMANLAMMYFEQDQLAEAESLDISVLDSRMRVLGEEHPDTLKSMGDLAATYYRQGRTEEAERLETRVLDIRMRVLGEDHPDTLESMELLVKTYVKRDQLEEAETLLNQIIAISTGTLGEEHPDTIRNAHKLALIYKTQGRRTDYDALVTNFKLNR